MISKYFSCAVSALAISTAAPVHAVTLDINLNFFGDLTDSQKSVFSAAENFWEYMITGYQYDVSDFFTSVQIEAGSTDIDGAYGILGQAAPTSGVTVGGSGNPVAAYVSDGFMQFDSADIDRLESSDTLFDVVVHEMAHVLGFGTLWDVTGDYTEGTGQYTGTAALAAYRAECDPNATFIPVEQDGGPGTADGHWDENWACGHTEVMTGFLDTPVTLSYTTVASFEDLGYTVVDALPTIAPVPLPAGVVLLGSGLLAFGAVGHRGRRRKQG